MSRYPDDGPVYYREIQKNAFLKRIPPDMSGNKLIGNKRPPLKAMWTLFCVHNGHTPYLEQYPEPESPSTRLHRPTWRASLATCRHVTASVRPWPGDEFDFLVATDDGPVRMLAQDWDAMQEWVRTLRDKLQELRVLGRGENVYCPSPAPALGPRVCTRDPTSPLPPTPRGPPVRVPGIELIPQRAIEENDEQTETNSELSIADSTTVQSVTDEAVQEPNTGLDGVQRLTWDQAVTQSAALPSTSQEAKVEQMSVTKICGQSVCLDDSVLRRNSELDEEFFREIDRLSLNDDVPLIADATNESGDIGGSEFKQRVVIGGTENETKPGPSCVAVSEREDNINGFSRSGLAASIHGPEFKLSISEYSGTNITVIQVSNKGPPHTAIPVLGDDTNIFQFDFKQKVSINLENASQEALNTNENFVNIVNTESERSNVESYGTVYKDDNESPYGHISLTTTVNLTGTNEGTYERLCMASTSKDPLPKRRSAKNTNQFPNDKEKKSSLPNLNVRAANSTYEYLFPQQTNVNNSNNLNSVQSDTTSAAQDSSNTEYGNSNRNIANAVRSNAGSTQGNSNFVQGNTNSNNRSGLVHSSSLSSTANLDLNASVNRGNVERSHSQNSYDSGRLRERLLRTRNQNQSPKRNNKIDQKQADNQQKPIWKRGLTELSLLSRLRGIAQNRNERESPTPMDDGNERVTTSPTKVIRRSRVDSRADNTRRRSSSLSNEASVSQDAHPLRSLRSRQAASLRAEQARGAACVARVYRGDAPVLVDVGSAVWIASWGRSGSLWGGRTGDRVAAVRGIKPNDSSHANMLIRSAHTHTVDILFHRVPHGKIYVLNKNGENQSIGIKLDNECQIVSVEPSSAAHAAGLPPGGSRWSVTEVNNRQINIVKGGDEEMNRLCSCGNEVSVLIQPAPLVKKLRAALKGNKTFFNIR